MIKSSHSATKVLNKVFNGRHHTFVNRTVLIQNNGIYNAATRVENKLNIAHEKYQLKTKATDANRKKQTWRNTKKLLTTLGVSATSVGVCLIAIFGAPEIDIDGKPIKDDLFDKPILEQYLVRAYRECVYYSHLATGPLSEKLLPDPLAYPYKQPKYTLVLELTDVLVHPEWSYSTGWRFRRRPMLDHFLEILKDSYEIVIYTGEHGRIVFPLLDALDPKNVIAYKLVRGTTRFTGRTYVKRLDHLNRDLSKVICVDWNYRSVINNPENLFLIKRWDGNDDDTSLMDLATFLKTIADSDIEDVRDVLMYYSQYPDPITAFREKQERLIEDLENRAAADRRQRPSNISRLFGFPSKKK